MPSFCPHGFINRLEASADLAFQTEEASTGLSILRDEMSDT
jgi:hypothetical protein